MSDRNLFVISSAIHAKFGVYSLSERISQTEDTISSIRKFCDADIVMLDGGFQKLSSEELKSFNSLGVDVRDYSALPEIQGVKNSPNWDVVKNIAEISMFESFFRDVNLVSESLPVYGRIFKISGRYRLSDDFSLMYHANSKGKFVFKKDVPSQFKGELTKGVGRQYMCRLWSADWALLPSLSNLFGCMKLEFIDAVRSGGYLDIEHLFFKMGGFKSEVQHLPPSKVRRCKVPHPSAINSSSLKTG